MSSTFQKFTSFHFTFMKDLYLYLFWLNEGNPKRIFTFTKKRWDAKTAFCVCFRVSCNRGSAQPQQREWDHQAPFPDPPASQHLATILWPMSLGICALSHLFCASVSKMCPEVIVFSFYMPFGLAKVFIEALYFQIAWETCVALK